MFLFRFLSPVVLLVISLFITIVDTYTTTSWTPTVTKSLGNALVAAVSSTLDGAGVDTYFRNSGDLSCTYDCYYCWHINIRNPPLLA